MRILHITQIDADLLFLGICGINGIIGHTDLYICEYLRNQRDRKKKTLSFGKWLRNFLIKSHEVNLNILKLLYGMRWI